MHRTTLLFAEAFLENKTWLSPFQQRGRNARSTAARLVRRTRVIFFLPL
jgi:hypothetical protein